MSLYEEMLAAADPSQVPGLSRFFKTGPGQYGEGDKFLGIKVPVTRSIVRRCWRELAPGGREYVRNRAPDGHSRSGGFSELEKCITSEFHEMRLAALLTLVEIFKHAKEASRRPAGQAYTHAPCHSEPSEESLRRQCIDFYLSHTPFINNWDLVDLSCYPLLGEWLLDKDRSLLYDLARSGRTIWEQRIGIVSTMTFVRHGQLQDTFAIADILLHHPHDLIHKAVGWLLREAGKRDKPALVSWLQLSPSPCHSERSEESLPRYLQMPRTMLRYAIEKFPEAERQQYLTGTK